MQDLVCLSYDVISRVSFIRKKMKLTNGRNGKGNNTSVTAYDQAVDLMIISGYGATYIGNPPLLHHTTTRPISVQRQAENWRLLTCCCWLGSCLAGYEIGDAAIP